MKEHDLSRRRFIAVASASSLAAFAPSKVSAGADIVKKAGTCRILDALRNPERTAAHALLHFTLK